MASTTATPNPSPITCESTPRSRWKQKRLDKFNPSNHPRDERGRFTSKGKSAAGIMASPGSLKSYQATKKGILRKKGKLTKKQTRIGLAMTTLLATATVALLAADAYQHGKKLNKLKRESEREWESEWESEFDDWYKQYKEQYKSYGGGGYNSRGGRSRSQSHTSSPSAADNAYSVLGLDKNASPEDVKRAYRKKAREFHPDVNKDPGAEEMMKEINNAFDILDRQRKDALMGVIIQELHHDFNPNQPRDSRGRFASKGSFPLAKGITPTTSQKGGQAKKPTTRKTGAAKKDVPDKKTGILGKKAQRRLIAAGVTTAIAGTAVYASAQQVKQDIKTSQVDFDSIRQPPDGVPDEETFKKYDSFKPGDLIRKNFKSDRLGTRQHYAVYMGKDPATGEHMLIDTGEDWKNRDSVPYVRKRGLTWDAGPNDSEYEVVPEKEMHLEKGTKKFTREEIAERADKMLYQRFTYKGFSSNCEGFARAIVEGKGYSAQAKKVSTLTNGLSGLVTNNVLKLRTKNEWYPGAQDEKTRLKIAGYEFTGLSDYSREKYRMTAQEMADFLDFDPKNPGRSIHHFPWARNGPRASARLAQYLEYERVRDARRKTWEHIPNPYGEEAKPKALPGTRDDSVEEILSGDLMSLCLSSKLSKPYNDERYAYLGIEHPEVYAEKVEAIAATVQNPAAANRVRLMLASNYIKLTMLALRANLIAAKSSKEAKNDVIDSLRNAHRFDFDPRQPRDKRGRFASKNASGRIQGASIKSRLTTGKRPKTGKRRKISKKQAAGIAAVGVGAIATGLVGAQAAKAYQSAYGLPSVPRKELSILSKDDFKKVEIEKKVGIQGANSDTYFVKDGNGNRKIFKTYKSDVFLQQVSVEATLSDIAKSAGIEIPSVEMVPAHQKNKGGINTGKYGGVLQSVAKGETVGDYTKRTGKEFTGIKLGEWQKNDKYVSDELVKGISQHPDLAKIAAFDTFAGNWDRHKDNLFYDEETDTYTGIDMGVSFENNIAGGVLDYMKKKKGTDFTQSEREGLQTYRDTLQELHSKWGPKDIRSRVFSYIEHENSDSPLIHIGKRLLKSRSIDDSHRDTARLIKQLDKILEGA